MTRQASEEKRIAWLNRLDRQASSGLSVAAYCRKESISEANFYYWKRKLSRSSSSCRAKSVGREASSTGPRFVQLRATSQPSPHVEFTVADGTLIRVPADELGAVAAVAQVFASSVDTGERDDA